MERVESGDRGLDLPVAPPLAVRANELRTQQPLRCSEQRALAPVVLEHRTRPREPASEELALADAPRRHLHRVLDALLALLLERLVHLLLQLGRRRLPRRRGLDVLRRERRRVRRLERCERRLVLGAGRRRLCSRLDRRRRLRLLLRERCGVARLESPHLRLVLRCRRQRL